METKKSIVVKDMEHCFVCGSNNVEIHHALYGNKNRSLADKYKLVVPLCHNHHQGKISPHQNREFDLLLKRMAQKAFNTHYPDEDFLKVFGRNYL